MTGLRSFCCYESRTARKVPPFIEMKWGTGEPAPDRDFPTVDSLHQLFDRRHLRYKPDDYLAAAKHGRNIIAAPQ